MKTGERASKPVNPSLIEFFLHVSDVLAVLIAGFIAFYFFDGRIDDDLVQMYINTVILGVIVSSMAIFLCGGYDTPTFFSLPTSYRAAFIGFFLTTSVLLAVGFAFKVTGTFSRFWAGSWLASSFGLIMLGRFLVWSVALRLRKRGIFNSRIIIVGAGEQGERLARFINTSQWLTMRVIGFIDDRADRVADEVAGIPVLGDRKSLLDLIRADKVDQVFVSLPWSAADRLQEIIDDISEAPVKIRLAPDLAIFNFGNRTVSSLGGLPVVNLFDRPIKGGSLIMKKLEDYVLSSLILLFISPILLLIGRYFFDRREKGSTIKPLWFGSFAQCIVIWVRRIIFSKRKRMIRGLQKLAHFYVGPALMSYRNYSM